MRHLLSLIACLAACAPAASAAVISVSLYRSADSATTTLAASDVAGVEAVANWNNVGTTSALNLKDSTGTSTTTDLAITTFTAYTNTTGSGTANERMMRSFIGSQSGSPTFTFSDLGTAFTSAGYRVYVYFGGPGGSTTSSTVSYSMSATGYAGTSTYFVRHANQTWDGTFTRSLATTSGSAVDEQDYVLFEGLTASSFVVTYNGGTNFRSGISGIQIVAVPEPTAIAGLLGIGMLALRRRR